MTKRVIELFFFDAGGGHRSAALALQQVIASQHPGWEARLVNLQDLLQPVDPVSRMSKKYCSQDIYNGMLKRGWTYGSSAMLRGMQHAIKLLAPLCEERLRDHWAGHKPDLVVSLIPNFNAVLFRALRTVHAQVPYVTVMTDIADCPPHFWQEKQDQYLVCGSDRAVQQARKLGYQPAQVLQTSGMILDPKYYASAPAENLTRAQMGLADDIPTALVMFGGYASSKALSVVDQLAKAARPLQGIVICGHNDKLRQQLENRPNCHAVGFTRDVPAYMRAADFFIGKPGPGSISEALHMKLPVLVERNARTMPQERYNTAWVRENGYGLTFAGARDIPAAVEALLAPAFWNDCQARLTALDNRAVYEVPALFAQIMDTHTALSRSAA